MARRRFLDGLGTQQSASYGGGDTTPVKPYAPPPQVVYMPYLQTPPPQVPPQLVNPVQFLTTSQARTPNVTITRTAAPQLDPAMTDYVLIRSRRSVPPGPTLDDRQEAEARIIAAQSGMITAARVGRRPVAGQSITRAHEAQQRKERQQQEQLRLKNAQATRDYAASIKARESAEAARLTTQERELIALAKARTQQDPGTALGLGVAKALGLEPTDDYYLEQALSRTAQAIPGLNKDQYIEVASTYLKHGEKAGAEVAKRHYRQSYPNLMRVVDAFKDMPGNFQFGLDHIKKNAPGAIKEAAVLWVKPKHQEVAAALRGKADTSSSVPRLLQTLLPRFKLLAAMRGETIPTNSGYLLGTGLVKTFPGELPSVAAGLDTSRPVEPGTTERAAVEISALIDRLAAKAEARGTVPARIVKDGVAKLNKATKAKPTRRYGPESYDLPE